jgi:YegS/Rv2252/BmrU family lipid kinase
MLTKITVFYNPFAGRNKTARMHKALKPLAEKGFQLKLVETQLLKESNQINRDYIDAIKEQDAVLIVGGDGSIANVLNGLGEHLKIPFGVLPLGTINLLAREMKVTEQNFDTAFYNNQTQDIHLGQVNERLFCITTSVGIDASAVVNVDLELKRKIGRLAYIVSLLKTLKEGKGDAFKVRCHEQSFNAKAVIVMNGCYYAGSNQLGQNTSLKSRGFEIYLLKENNIFNLIKYGLNIFFNRLHHSKNVQVLQSDELEITSEKQAPLQIDGDPGPDLPATIKSFAQTYKIVADL